jgi:hypothetical protein
MERCNAGLSFWIVRSRLHKHADPPLGLLRALRAATQRLNRQRF